MKYSFLIVAFMFFTTVAMSQTKAAKETKETKAVKETRDTKAKVLRHVVLFKFKDASTPADIDTVIKEFTALKAKIKQIKGLEWGLNNSPEKLDQGLTHAFILTFSSEKDRDDYLIHPEHKKFGDIVGGQIDKVVVVDFWVK